MKTFIALLVLLFMALPVQAADYTLGTDGLYYSAGVAYTRSVSKVWVEGYYYYKGCCRYWYPGYYQQSYSYKAAPLPDYKDPNWRNKLLTIVESRKKYEDKVLAEAAEQNNYIEAIREFGLTGSLQSYGLIPTLANPYRGHYQATYAVQGNTQYAAAAYQNSNVTDVYGLLDKNLFMQQASAFSRDALAMAGQGHAANLQYAEKDGAWQARVAEILAKGQSAAQTLQAANAAPSASIRSTESGTYPVPLNGQQQPQQGQFSPRRLAAMRNCVACHGDSNPRGGYKVSTHWSLSAEDQIKVVEHLVAESTDPLFMPKLPSGQPGQRLPSSLILEFMPIEDRARVQSQ